MDQKLIFDLGMHRGEDTAFYLRKGFRVVAVDADPELCERAGERFASEIASGALVVLNLAIAGAPGKLTLYKNTSRAIWNTLRPEWAQRNREQGTQSIEIEVEAAPLDALFQRYGAPYYLKIDIEGMDLTALEAIARQPGRPKFISIESDKVSFAAIRREFEVFATLGYDQFKLVAQHRVHLQRAPDPPKEGGFVDHAFEMGSSGLFGEEAPGHWMSAPEAIDAYRPVFLRYALTGDDPLVRNRYVRALLKRAGWRAGWYDTHARLAS
jgi:FkbM family methyltransferase